MIATAAPSRMSVANRIAFGWGLAEAVLFFVIPDVFLTLLAIRFGLHSSWRPALWATTGAVVGGLIVYLWAALDSTSVFAVMNALPGIDGEMIESVRLQSAQNGSAALLAGPWQGVPYKLYAAATGQLGSSALSLAILTIPGRLSRFVVSIGVAAYLRWFFDRWFSQRALVAAWALFWLLVYLGYWFG